MRHSDGVYYFDNLVEAGPPNAVGEAVTLSIKSAEPVKNENAKGELPTRTFEQMAEISQSSAARILNSSLRYANTN